jgi:hypothetical protein
VCGTRHEARARAQRSIMEVAVVLVLAPTRFVMLLATHACTLDEWGRVHKLLRKHVSCTLHAHQSLIVLCVNQSNT